MCPCSRPVSVSFTQEPESTFCKAMSNLTSYTSWYFSANGSRMQAGFGSILPSTRIWGANPTIESTELCVRFLIPSWLVNIAWLSRLSSKLYITLKSIMSPNTCVVISA
jgi:hypothetical protein